MERHDRRGAPALCAETVRINFLSDGELTRAPSADEDKNKQDVERYQTELAEWEKNHPKTRQDLKDFKVEDVIQDDSAYKNSLLGEERNEARASGLLVAANAWLYMTGEDWEMDTEG